MTITINAIKEKIRRKELYIVTVIGILILLLFGTGSGTITIGGRPITDYESLAPILIIIINAICGALAIALSIRTIPNEYERKTSHLIWIRGVSQTRFHGELALANGISSLIAEAILYMGFILFMFSKGKGEEVWRVIPAFVIMAVSILIVSLFTSVLSIVLPGMVTGVIVSICYLAGIFHGILELVSNMISGVGSALLRGVLFAVPDLNALQAQAGNVIRGNSIESHVIWKGLLVIYIISIFFSVFKRKEA